jgi:hypothetical protein
MKVIVFACLSTLLLSGCFSSPAQSFLAIGYVDKRVFVNPKGNTPSGIETPSTGHGNGSIAIVEQAMVVYKSPMAASSNSVSPTVEIPLTK